MNLPGVKVYADAGAVARALADTIVSAGEEAIARNGSFHLALSGGSTPRAAYERLALDPDRDELSWSDVFVYFGDERCVGPDDEQSNYRMARTAFLDEVPIPKPTSIVCAAKSIRRKPPRNTPGFCATTLDRRRSSTYYSWG